MVRFYGHNQTPIPEPRPKVWIRDQRKK